MKKQLVFFLLLPLRSIGQILPLSDFKETRENDLPLYGNGDLYDVMTSSSVIFSVANKDGKLAVTKLSEHRFCELQLLNGKLIGEDRGEFGGSLKFQPNDTSKAS